MRRIKLQKLIAAVPVAASIPSKYICVVIAALLGYSLLAEDIRNRTADVAHAASKQGIDAQFVEWLGPQERGHKIPDWLRPRLERLEITLYSDLGKNIKLPKTSNMITRIEDSKVVESKEFRFDADKTYVVSIITGPNGGNAGGMIYILDVEVVNGPLKGAIIHCRSGVILETYLEPMIAVFEVPENLTIKPEKIEFKIVAGGYK